MQAETDLFEIIIGCQRLQVGPFLEEVKSVPTQACDHDFQPKQPSPTGFSAPIGLDLFPATSSSQKVTSSLLLTWSWVECHPAIFPISKHYSTKTNGQKEPFSTLNLWKRMEEFANQYQP